MPTGQDVLRSARRFEGERYSTAGGRTSQTSGFKDCSGLVAAALVGVGVNVPGYATVSTGAERWAVANGGRYISREEALWTPGAGLTVGGRSGGWVGLGPRGHIGLSVGNGRDHYGTPRPGYGRSVGTAPFNNHGWEDYFTWPGIDHRGTGKASAPAPKKQRTNKHVIFVISGGDKGEAYQYVGGPTTDKQSYIRLWGNEAIVNIANGSPHVTLNKREFRAYLDRQPLNDLGGRGWSF